MCLTGDIEVRERLAEILTLAMGDQKLMRTIKQHGNNRIGDLQLIIVTGRPAAGKTTLAQWLARELQIPVISKDSIREVLFHQLGWKDREWAQMLGRATIDLMFYFAERQLEVGRSLLLDNAFDPVLSASRFLDLTTRYGAQTIQIICNSDQDTLFERFKARADLGGRHPGHRDADVFDQLRSQLAQNHSPRMELAGPVLEVDTTDFDQVDYQSILRQVKLIVASG